LPADALAAVAEFRKLIKYVMIYDITVTPEAKRNKTLEGLLTNAGIPINNGIVIDQKLSNEILESRFIGADKADKGGGNRKLPQQEVEMFFVRGTIQQIDAVKRKNPANSGVQIDLDLAVAPRDLHLFLQLNQATGLEVAEMKRNPRSLRVPAAFRLPAGALEAGSQLAMADLTFLMNQGADQGAATSADANDPNQPGQAIFVIREAEAK
jgi:hypothetical protein